MTRCPETSVSVSRETHPPRWSAGLGALLFAFALLGSACTGIARPQGWASPVERDGLLLASHRKELVAFESADVSAKWKFPGDDKEDQIDNPVALYGTPAISEGTVFIPTYKGVLYAVDLDTGEFKWRFDTADDDPLVGPVTASAGTVYFGDNEGRVHALDTASGEERWHFDTDDKVWSAPIRSGDTLFVTSLDGRLYALSAASGDEQWSFQTSAGIAATPVVNDAAGLVYIAGLDSELRAVDIRTQEERWSLEGGNQFWATPLLSEGVLYAADTDGNVYALNAATGEERWDQPFQTDAPVRAAPVLLDSTVLFVVDRSGKVYGIDAPDGSRAIERELDVGDDVLADPLLHAGEDGGQELLVVTTAGDLVRIDTETLEILKRTEL